MFLVIGFARLVDRAMKMETIILTGIIFGSFLRFSFFANDCTDGGRTYVKLSVGCLAVCRCVAGIMSQMILPFVLIGSILLWFNRRELNAMLFGEERAHHLGSM